MLFLSRALDFVINSAKSGIIHRPRFAGLLRVKLFALHRVGPRGNIDQERLHLLIVRTEERPLHCILHGSLYLPSHLVRFALRTVTSQLSTYLALLLVLTD